ncbi:hypothetical protein [Sphingopyxis sp.]|jgi:hypothetical protein|uniref:hypothetical protein n=1 Tax=Sphingopyxis sp. TaxID=1908224 RepID=UPI00311DD28A
MTIPKVRDETSVNEREGSRQAVKSNEAAGRRIKEALGDREVSWLVRETGYGDSTIRDALRRGPVRSDVALAIASALSVSVDWLLTGRRSNTLIPAEDAEWVEIPEYSTYEIDELGKLEPITTTLMRKDWLYASLGDTTGIWMAQAPARNDALSIDAGTMLFCKDHRPGDRMTHGAYYLFRINGGVIMARYSLRDGNDGEETVSARDMGHEEDQYVAVARVIGEYARPL